MEDKYPDKLEIYKVAEHPKGGYVVTFECGTQMLLFASKAVNKWHYIPSLRMREWTSNECRELDLALQTWNLRRTHSDLYEWQ